MKSTKTLKVIGFCAVLAGLFISSNSVTFAAGLPQVQTLAVTNISGTSVTLQGNVSDMGGVSSVGVWFQWGSTQNYGTNTNYVVQNYNGAFSQQIVTSPGQTYHYRAVAQNSYGISYGQDMTFVSGQNSGNSQVVV